MATLLICYSWDCVNNTFLLGVETLALRVVSSYTKTGHMDNKARRVYFSWHPSLKQRGVYFSSYASKRQGGIFLLTSINNAKGSYFSWLPSIKQGGYIYPIEYPKIGHRLVNMIIDDDLSSFNAFCPINNFHFKNKLISYLVVHEVEFLDRIGWMEI